MQKRIFLYLFVFAALTAIFLGVSGSNRIEALEKEVTNLEQQEELYKDSLEQSFLQILDMQYFSLENNDEALSQFDHIELEDPTGYVSDRLLETNEMQGNNPLVPYEGMNGDFKINKIKILNHKWLICDFSDGKYWGELFIRYEVKENRDVDFTVADHLLYTSQF